MPAGPVGPGRATRSTSRAAPWTDSVPSKFTERRCKVLRGHSGQIADLCVNALSRQVGLLGVPADEPADGDRRYGR